ncbi:MAG: helix-turn-helix domain-containing protein [Oligoflexales bacterium]|nr:helix-turn-helix domain-containing protein [Oligoflexales bacterium]
MGKEFFDNRIEVERPVDVFEIAEFLGKKPSTVRNWISTGRFAIPHFRLGNKSMFFKSCVSKWLREVQQENMK